ncbi:MAG: ABC transporter, substrate-binding protein (cluster 1, maltose/g3p/polyamine/iron) [uncultured Frankineae bacterium]|uniref:ABC transporter, substrate-binding protein (Cluster 1, maltose/g3p/polyamine/iron) n=1 Tax=uncultured Frankineae bacterium TaxID=437475 RepID=A0A6J4MLD9_9ACTN|nr:MAG: ABC transporter, substrate-binding protein (cluster 1, maltose/g3p/polyamine/iron) [uncultured Frankineae bacterium]
MTRKSVWDRGRSRRLAAGMLAALSATALSACGSDQSGGTPQLNWYINNAAQEPIAQACNEQADGAYQVNISLLPAAASGQREQLLRRLAAGDDSVDILSLDPPFMAEFANAGFLRPFTDDETQEFSEGVLKGPLEQSMYEDKMFSAPFYGNTQLLWYKKSVAEKAGLDLEQPVTWDQVIEAAEKTSTTVAVQGRRNESLMVWVNALVESAGGRILSEDSQGASADEVKADIDSEAGQEAARIMSTIAESPVSPPALSTAGEEESRAAFQSDNGGFMVNWPYVWSAFAAAEKDGTLPEDFRKDVAWARYPRVVEDTPSATPLGGIGISVGAYTAEPEAAVEAIRCLRSAESQKAYMMSAGDPAAAEEVYEDSEIQEQFPMYEAIREGLTDAAPRPISAFYGDVTGAIQQGYHPPRTLSPERTPTATAELLEGVLSNEQLL